MEILDFRVRPRTEWYYKDLYPTPIPEFRRYVEIYHAHHLISLKSFEDSIADMRAAGVTKGVIFSGDAAGNKLVADTCRQYPDAYVGLAGAKVDHGIRDCVESLRQAFDEFGLCGWNMGPYLTGVYAEDRRNYPGYALCEEKKKCVVIHSSVHYNPGKSIDFGDPKHIDQVAVDFPGLKLVMAHAGYGFGELGLMVANRHDNMFVDFTGLHPHHLPKQAIAMISGPLKRKAIFGTNFPCLDYPIVDEWMKLLKDDAKPYFFYKNAARALGLE